MLHVRLETSGLEIEMTEAYRCRYMEYSISLSPYMLEELNDYINLHKPVCDFLFAVLENNLREAVGLADDHNKSNLPAYVAYLYNEAPSACWGSPEKVTAWLNERSE